MLFAAIKEIAVCRNNGLVMREMLLTISVLFHLDLLYTYVTYVAIFTSRAAVSNKTCY